MVKEGRPGPAKGPELSEAQMRSGGESEGGAYPNPHKGTKPGQGGMMGSGGQSEMEYHGSGQLGTQRTGDNPNAPARKG